LTTRWTPTSLLVRLPIPALLFYSHSLFVMATVGYLKANPTPSRAELAHGISGNLCRCAGYEQIIEAVLAAAAGEERETAPATPSVGDRSAVPDANVAPQ